MEFHKINYSVYPAFPTLPTFKEKEEGVFLLESSVINGSTQEILPTLPTGFVQTVITSPPYWSLRDYSVPGQIGLEDDPDDFVASLVKIFKEVYRILRDDGIFWLNVGDSYTSGGRTWRAPDKKNPVRAMTTRPPTPRGLKSKELVGVPWRLAFALQEVGWYLRADIIWNKPNCQPESVKDRPTRSHEYVFMLTKSEQYFYDNNGMRGANNRNLRTVWDINTEGFKEAHFATFPTQLVKQCLMLSTRPGDIVLDPFLGSGTVGAIAFENARPFIGIELNPEYIEIARRRIAQGGGRLDRRLEEVG